MDNKIIEIAKKKNGFLTNNDLKNNNIPTIYIYRLAKKEVFKKIEKGIFILNGYVEDEFYVIHLLYPKVVFCFETALYLNNLSNNQFSGYFGVVSYNDNAPKYSGLHIKRSRKNTIELGVTYIETPFGNKVKCYDKERCICDLFINKEEYDYEDRIYAINEYKSKYLNIKKLYEYAKTLKIYDEVKNVFEVLRWN